MERTINRLVFFIIAILRVITTALLQGHEEPLGKQGAPYQPVDQLSFPPSARDFYKQYIRASKPVVIRNAINTWPAYERWKDYKYLKKVHGHEPFNVEFRKKFKNVFPVRKAWRLTRFLDEFQEKKIYLDSLFRINSTMTGEVLLPPSLQCKRLSDGIDNLNLLMSSGNTSSAFHHDGYENLLSIISGEKEIILYDSKYTRLLEADNVTVAAGVSQIDPERLDLVRYPIMAELPYFVASLKPGDMLYIPQYWWHQVRSYNNPNIAVGMWFSVFNFQQEFEQRNIDETEHVIKITETFRELLEKEPLEIACEDTGNVNKTSLYSPVKSGILDAENQLRKWSRHTCMY